MSFDNCGGHGDVDHRYHYHIPPICLLQMLEGTTPTRSDWWLAAHPESQWPKKGKSALVGWALDGHPIFGPYDPDTGNLMVSGGSGCAMENELDVCNGKVLENGLYAYFLSPTYPFVPPCLRGEPGLMKDPEPSKYERCPVNGYAPPEMQASKSCETAPQFLFFEVENTPQWRVSTAVVGVGFLLIAAFIGYVIRPDSFMNRSSVGDDAGNVNENTPVLIAMYWTLLCLCFFRTFFLLVDPYRIHRLLPNLLSGLLYGLVYPLLNLLAVLMLHQLGLLKCKKKLRAAVGVVVCQVFVQVIMDGLRAYGKQPSWHWICQVFYVVWGLTVLFIGVVFSVMRGRLVAATALAMSLIHAILSTLALSVKIGGPSSDEYFYFMTALRLLELFATAGYAVVLLGAARTMNPSGILPRGPSAFSRAASRAASHAARYAVNADGNSERVYKEQNDMTREFSAVQPGGQAGQTAGQPGGPAQVGIDVGSTTTGPMYASAVQPTNGAPRAPSHIA